MKITTEAETENLLTMYKLIRTVVKSKLDRILYDLQFDSHDLKLSFWQIVGEIAEAEENILKEFKNDTLDK